MTDFTFWLGTHHPAWLARAGVPLFVSRRQLARQKKVTPAIAPWALDSGGFTEISMHGRYETSVKDYAAEIVRWHDEIGQLAWVAPQDWMCEMPMLAKTGLSVQEHQRRTVGSYLDLAEALDGHGLAHLAVPVLQGWTIFGDYHRCAELYEAAGVDLAALPLVGLGSVCRRSSSIDLSLLLHHGVPEGLRLHGFGVKGKTLEEDSDRLASSDSLAWSFQARREGPDPRHSHKSCANCMEYALWWRENLLDHISRSRPENPDLDKESRSCPV